MRPSIFKRSLCAAICVLGWVALVPPAGATDEKPDADAVTFIYIHGFGGKREDPKFCRNLRGFLEDNATASSTINYPWDSVTVDPLRPKAAWLRSQQRADEEAARFKIEVIDKHEAKGAPYVLIGFSVGSRVVLQALEKCDTELKYLAGIYFLGSALTKDTTLANRVALPRGTKITNYHSPRRDKVHAMAFKLTSDIPAGGQEGFDDGAVFENFPVACSHAHKGVGVPIDYSGLAEAIGAIELYQQGVRLPGETSFNIRVKVGAGEFWWNKVMKLEVDSDGQPATVEIEQHNARPGYYRALLLKDDDTRHRIARGHSLSAILETVSAKQ